MNMDLGGNRGSLEASNEASFGHLSREIRREGGMWIAESCSTTLDPITFSSTFQIYSHVLNILPCYLFALNINFVHAHCIQTQIAVSIVPANVFSSQRRVLKKLETEYSQISSWTLDVPSDQKCRIARIRENNRVSPQKRREKKKETNKRTNERMNEWGKKRRKKERKIPWQQHEAGIGAHGNRETTRRCVKPNIRIPDRIINHEFNQVYSVTRIRTRVPDIISPIARTNVRTYVRFQIDPLITHLSSRIYFIRHSIIIQQICYHANFTAFSHVYS